MTIGTLVFWIGLVAAGLTAVTVFMKEHKSILMTFFQYFTGVLFVFSGMVKAVDPLGTAYKMEQYFSEFEYTFQETAMSFLSPLFPALSELSVGFSVFMIVFEIVLGIMLIIGMTPKLTSWLFFLLVAFFTVLTGFTFLTGYVPDGVNFFEFGKWAEYKASNMKVTDCGCFGDFIKLEPRISFYKDLVLLVPAIYFLFKHKDMHRWFSSKLQWAIAGLSTIGLLIYCFSNYVWDLPHVDFRPFTVGKDVATQMRSELDAAANVQILSWKLEHKDDNKTLELSNEVYMSELATYNKKNGWRVVDQVMTEPAVKKTKISEFEITTFEGDDVSYEYIEGEKPNFMVISHKTYGKPNVVTETVTDSLFKMDTVLVEGTTDELQITKAFDRLQQREQERVDYVWDSDWLELYKSKIKPLAEAARKNGQKVSIVLGGADQNMADDLKGETGIEADYYTADDILLKTIVRSNPGVVLWNNGKIVNKWHIDKLPSYQELAAENL